MTDELTPEEVAAVEAEHRDDSPKEPEVVTPPAPALVDEYAPMIGLEVVVTEGEHAGQRAALLKVHSVNGTPQLALVRFKSTLYSQTHAGVPYDAIQLADHPGHQ